MTSSERKAANKYRSYLSSSKHDLYDAYKTGFSKAKYDAWKYCLKLKDEHDGKGLKVIGANTHFFSAGFVYSEAGEERFMYITHGGDYSVSVKEAREI